MALWCDTVGCASYWAVSGLFSNFSFCMAIFYSLINDITLFIFIIMKHVCSCFMKSSCSHFYYHSLTSLSSFSFEVSFEDQKKKKKNHKTLLVTWLRNWKMHILGRSDGAHDMIYSIHFLFFIIIWCSHYPLHIPFDALPDFWVLSSFTWHSDWISEETLGMNHHEPHCSIPTCSHDMMK